MKKLCYILFLFPFIIKAQYTRTDMHVHAGMVIGLGSSIVINHITHKPFLSAISGVALGMASGYAKERLDRKTKRGVYNENDIKATTWGACVSLPLFYLTINISDLIKNSREVKREFNRNKK